jgi:hypothetical protein
MQILGDPFSSVLTMIDNSRSDSLGQGGGGCITDKDKKEIRRQR